MKKALNILKNILTGLIVCFALCMMIFTIVSVTTLDKTDRSFLGYKAFIVLTDSMSATDFAAGDLVLVKEVDPKTLKEGDIISYRSVNLEHYYEVVTHKIGKKTTDRNGRPGFTTYGTTTGTSDEEIVYYENILGKYKLTIPKAGIFFQFLKTTPGYVVCILTPFLILILIQALHSIKLFKKYKDETLEEMNEEKKKLETERLENDLIRQQLELSEKKTKKIEKELADLKRELKKANEPEPLKAKVTKKKTYKKTKDDPPTKKTNSTKKAPTGKPPSTKKAQSVTKSKTKTKTLKGVK